MFELVKGHFWDTLNLVDGLLDDDTQLQRKLRSRRVRA